MVGLRIALSALILLVAGVITWILFVLHGFKQGEGVPGMNTLPVAIPWAVATAILAGLIVGAIASPARRATFSAWSFGLALVMAALILGVLMLG